MITSDNLRPYVDGWIAEVAIDNRITVERAREIIDPAKLEEAMIDAGAGYIVGKLIDAE